MEIAPVPHRASTRGARRRLGLVVLVVLPVVLLVLLPAVLGLDRSVVPGRGMHGSLGRGSVVLARQVPPTELAVGDVISFDAPRGPHQGQRVTRRITSLRDGVATTRADDTGTDPWRLELDQRTYARAWLGIPWLGLPFVVDGGWSLLLLAALVALAIALLTGRGHHGEALRRAAVARPSHPRQPVG